MSYGFSFDELDNLKQDFLRFAKDNFPKKTKSFLRKEVRKLKNTAKNIGKKEVKKKNGIYLKGFATGKVFKVDKDLCVRAYNRARHAHLIEDGYIHKTKDGKVTGFINGKHVFKKAEYEFASQFTSDIETFLDEITTKAIK